MYKVGDTVIQEYAGVQLACGIIVEVHEKYIIVGWEYGIGSYLAPMDKSVFVSCPEVYKHRSNSDV